MKFLNHWLAIALACGALTAENSRGQDTDASSAETPVKFKVLDLQRGPYQLKMLDNSDTYSQALAINAGGAIIGQREGANEDKTIFRIDYFFFDGENHYTMPAVKGFTNAEAIALSDTNIVVGYSSRVIGHPDGSLIAVAWEPLKKRITALPRPEGDISTHAQSISADGNRITGYSSGSERMRPVIWTRGEDNQWLVTVLPTIMDENPYIMSSRAVISPDGKLVAACCTADLSNGVYDSDLFVWREKDGNWEREHVSETQFYIRGVNNVGKIVGSLSTPRGKRLPCVVDIEDGDVKPIALLPGDTFGEALGINSDGVVVGFSDDLSGEEGGPQPFIWRDGKTTAMELGSTVYGAAHSITDDGRIAGYLDEPAGDKPAGDVEAEDGGRVLAFWTLKKEP